MTIKIVKGTNLDTGELLADMRKRSGKTQKQMAAHIGVSERTWQYYESNERPIKGHDLLRAIIYCHYDLTEVLKNFSNSKRRK